MAHRGWKMLWLRADTPVPLTGRGQQAWGRFPLSGGERRSELCQNSLCFVGRCNLDVNLFLHMFPLVSLFSRLCYFQGKLSKLIRSSPICFPNLPSGDSIRVKKTFLFFFFFFD